MARTHKLQVPLSPGELDQLDALRGSEPRAVFVRRCILQWPYRFEGVAAATAVPPVTQQDAPSAPIVEEPLPPPPAKQELRLPPNQRSAYTPKGKDWGTVRVGQYEFDVTGVELEEQADGSTVLRFADRSLVRVGEG